MRSCPSGRSSIPTASFFCCLLPRTTTRPRFVVVSSKRVVLVCSAGRFPSLLEVQSLHIEATWGIHRDPQGASSRIVYLYIQYTDGREMGRKMAPVGEQRQKHRP